MPRRGTKKQKTKNKKTETQTKVYSAVAGHHPWDVATETCKKFRRFLKNGVAAVMPDSFSPGACIS